MITTNKGMFFLTTGHDYDGKYVTFATDVYDSSRYYTFSLNATDEEITNEINNMED